MEVSNEVLQVYKMFDLAVTFRNSFNRVYSGMHGTRRGALLFCGSCVLEKEAGLVATSFFLGLSCSV